VTGAESWLTVPGITEDELWIGEMRAVEVGGRSILLLNVGGEIRAYANRCPHQASPLDDGLFEDGVLTCSSHLWEFDAASGAGINPSNACLDAFAVEIGPKGEIHVGGGPAAESRGEICLPTHTPQ
jgi:toluene monooxygenase system ferredoxin subunit